MSSLTSSSYAALATVVQTALLLVCSPFLVGWMRVVRCRLEGRSGPSLWQPWRDLRKLMRKERMRPDQASWVFALVPAVLLATALVASALVPLVSTDSLFAADSDLFTVVFLLLFGSVALTLGALDGGTAFGGMGSSRAMTIGALSEPAMLMAVLALSVQTGSSNLSSIVSATLHSPDLLLSPLRLLSFGSLIIVILAEAGRLPVDNPATHLELTMIHEAMVLEFSGPDFAVLTVAENLRLGVFVSLSCSLFLPFGIAQSHSLSAIAIGIVAISAKALFFVTVVSVFETFAAKVRLFRVPELLAGSYALSVLAIITGVLTR